MATYESNEEKNMVVRAVRAFSLPIDVSYSENVRKLLANILNGDVVLPEQNEEPDPPQKVD